MKRIGFFIAALLGSGSIASYPFNRIREGGDEPQKRPNIVFLFADDQRADAMGCSGNTYIETPHIDQLAHSGVRFSNAYVMGGHHGAISAPSRAMLMTGKNLYHTYQAYDMEKGMDDVVLNGVTTMPMYFAQYGYETFGTGKWHNGVKSFEASFQRGKNVFIGGMSNHDSVPCRDLVNGKLSEPIKKGYSTDLFADAAIRFLDDYAKGGRERPFFCYVAFTAPHDPRSPRHDYVGKYPDESIPLPGNFMKYHPFAYDDMRIRDENLSPWPRTPEIIRTSIADYYSMISHLDRRVGDIIEILKKNGLYDNTLTVYAADNGLAIGSHGLLGKQDLYEHSMKVPLIISGWDIPKGKVSEALVYLYDVFPTLSDLCHLPSPHGIDGETLSPVIKGTAKGVRSSLFTTYRNTVRAVRTTEWKLIRYPDRDYSQLFDLNNDPLEINNLALRPEYKSKVSEMMNLLVESQQEAGDTVSLTATRILPMEYDPTKFKQIPDPEQPEYILNKYFPTIEKKEQ
jgi:arylsulfatase A-like enzyme